MTPEQRAKWTDLLLRKEMLIGELKTVENDIETFLKDVLGEEMYQVYRRDVAAALSGASSRDTWDEIYKVLERLD